MTDMLNEDLGKFVVVTLWILLGIRSVLKVVEEIKTHFIFSNPPPEDRAIDTVMKKYIAEPDTRQMTILRLHILRLVPKATNTLSEYVILIAFPRQQWLRERFYVLSYTYFACPVTLA
jgi:hypothetical protein